MNMFTRLNAALIQVVRRDDSRRGRRKLSRNMYTLKRSHATTEFASLFVTGATKAANKPGSFFCRVCRKDMSVAAKGGYEIRRHFQGHKHFGRDQRYRLETPGWRVVDVGGQPLGAGELERRREEVASYPLVTFGNEYSFAEDLIEGEHYWSKTACSG